METAIGVFASRDRAAEAVKELLQQEVPENAVVFLTRSESEAKNIGKEFGTYVGGFVGGAAGMSAGVVAAILLVPGIGAVFALGFGAAALLGLTGAGAGSTLGKAVSDHSSQAQPTSDEKCSEDAAFFREVLKEGRSLIIVRTESRELATVACGILDRLGLGLSASTPQKMQTATRSAQGVTIVDVSGRITVGEGNLMLRDIVHGLIEQGDRYILLNLGDVHYVDSSGLGELVRTYTTVRNQGGELKLVNLSKRVNDLLQITKLAAVFDIAADEESGIRSFRRGPASEAVA